MQLMSRGDAAALVDLLQESLPIQVLRIVSSGPPLGMTEGEITRTVERSFPQCDGFVDLQDRVRATLSWMLAHGDIDSAGNHRFLRVPPYAVSHIVDRTITVQLLGDEHLDDVIRSKVNLLGCVLRADTVLADSGERETALPFPLGIKRTVIAPATVAEGLLECLGRLGVNHKDIAELGQTLPSITGLLMLPTQAYGTIAPSWGIWFSYDAHLPEGNRWRQIPSWQDAAPGLLRWVQALDRRGYFYSRYFWHDRKPKLAELSRSFALLWTYRLDKDAGRPTDIWVDGHDLWVPFEIPSEHQQWLALLSAKVERVYPYRHYILQRPTLAVGEQLHETLGVSVIAKRPRNQ